jgi:hypothetical protein
MVWQQFYAAKRKEVKKTEREERKISETLLTLTF